MDAGWWRATLPARLTLCSGQACAGTTVLEEVGVWRAYTTVGDGAVSLCGISQFPGPFALMIKVDHHAAALRRWPGGPRRPSPSIPHRARLSSHRRARRS